MTIDVKRIAELANLELNEGELRKLEPQLEKIVSYIAKLSEVETGHLTTTARVTDFENITREDEPGKSLTQKEALSNAKSQEKGQFKVDAILNNE